MVISLGQGELCIWPSWCHCHSLSLAPVNPDWFSFLVLPLWCQLTCVHAVQLQFKTSSVQHCYYLRARSVGHARMFCVGLKTGSQNMVKNVVNMSARLNISEYYWEKKMMHPTCLKLRKSIDIFIFITHSSYIDSIRPLFLHMFISLFLFFTENAFCDISQPILLCLVNDASLFSVEPLLYWVSESLL